MTTIINYGMGNIRSIAKAVMALGGKVIITESPKKVKQAKRIILPGVGHFGQAMLELKKRNLIDVIKKKISEDKIPFLGICLGMQLLFKHSEEAPHVHGLNIIEGEVKRFRKKNLTIPHMGWNRVAINPKHNEACLFKSISGNNFFYFAHSYYCAPKNKNGILTTTYYGIKFTSSLHRENIWAVQFHPEKSQALGLKLLKNFIKLC